ncbi:MAG: glycosyltransferase [Gammaproteobacteria bacterium]|nr:MAG: glycosyltransferase [Gammaproteobacteria bacterium]PHR85012.1 MAG: glycosyltransferase [Colwellia sp.]
MKNLLTDLSQLTTHSKDCTKHVFDKILSTLMVITLSPVMMINILCSLITRQPIYTYVVKKDALGHSVITNHFTCGILKSSALLINIFMGQLSFCGVPSTHRLAPQVQARIKLRYSCKPGIFSLFDLHRRTGLVIQDPETLLLKQLNSSSFDNALLLLKNLVCYCLYTTPSKGLIDTKKISLFGLNLENLSMQEAVNWVTTTPKKTSTKSSTKISIKNTVINKSTSDNINTVTNIGFFINVNSINLCLKQPDFHHTLQQADKLLADGSGMRLAAKSAGYLLKDNTNGTDMLPHLCLSCIEQSKSIYFLGSKLGVAAKAASNLKKQFPGLLIAGTEHGFIGSSQLNKQIEKINKSGCDILLVAMGSPFQEKWLLEHKEQLQCQTALAVGGLFDFYSGEIARAPLWLRELGLEWGWRLWQEPMVKFKRYVIGTPLFLFRIYVLGLARKGDK